MYHLIALREGDVDPRDGLPLRASLGIGAWELESCTSLRYSKLDYAIVYHIRRCHML